MKIKPCGFHVLVDITKAESVTTGGIILPTELVEKEQMAEETGTIVAFGPTCFVGTRGCEREGIPAYEQWGLKIGDKIEFRKFEGKKSFVDGHENYRYIPDMHILGVINDEA